MHPYNSALTPSQIDRVTALLVQASALALRIYDDYVHHAKGIDTTLKPDNSPVTAADMAVHNLVTEHLSSITPNIFCLSEESASQAVHRLALDTLWLLDPIDGTREFIKQSGQFTINLALIHKHQVVASWLVVPKRGVLYFKHKTAASSIHKLNFKRAPITPEQNQTPLHTAQDACKLAAEAKTAAKPMMAKCESLTKKQLLRIGLSNNAQIPDYRPYLQAIQRTFSASIVLKQAGSALKYAMLLEDEIDLYIRLYPTCEWDTASGQGLIESIGGMLIDLQGNRFIYNARSTLKNGAFLCFKCSADKPSLLDACAIASTT